MGLFDKVKGAINSAQSAYSDAQSRVAQTKAKIDDVRDTVTGEKDTRDFPPQELLIHQQHECIPVYDAKSCQDAINALPGNTAKVVIGKTKIHGQDSYPAKSGTGAYLGSVLEKHLEKAMIKPGASVLVEVYKPIYNGQTLTTLYIPMTNEAIERKKLLDSLKFWGNLDAAKWEQDSGERFDYYNVEILTKDTGKKPIYVVIGDGSKLFEVNSRMKLYKELETRTQYKPRRLIVEQNNGEKGIYYRVGFYY